MKNLVYYLMQKTCQPVACTSKILIEFHREEHSLVCWTRQPVVKGDPVGDLDTPMREFMEWEGCPQSFNREGRIYHWREVVDSNSIYLFILFYEGYTEEWDF